MSQQQFNQWVDTAQRSNQPLNYAQLAKPSQNNSATTYSSVSTALYNSIIIKYMTPLTTTGGTQ
jgi:hypothetical protein